MKKEVIIIFMVLLLIGCASASLPSCNRKDQFKIKLMQADSNKNLIDTKTFGWVSFVKGNKVRAVGYKLEPFKHYVLISVESGENNSLYVTCINKKQATRNGNLKINQFVFDYSCFLDDGKEQEFLIAKLNDVDCFEHKFIKMNPGEYLYGVRKI